MSFQKQVLQDYSKITGTDETGEAEEISGEIAGSDDEGAKKKKTPSMYRVLKQRLQKLIEKTDESYVLLPPIRTYMLTPPQRPCALIRVYGTAQ